MITEKNERAATVKIMLFGVNKYLEFIGNELRVNNKDLAAHRSKTPDEQLTTDKYLRVLSAEKLSGRSAFCYCADNLQRGNQIW